METEETSDGYPGVAQVAIQQGKQLGQNLTRLQRNKPMKPFRYKDKGSLATVGRNRAVADLPMHIQLAGFPGWVTWMVIHLLFLVGFRNKLVVFSNWMWNYFSYDRGIRLIIRPFNLINDPISKIIKDTQNKNT
jgi:NADH dehydrogenase